MSNMRKSPTNHGMTPNYTTDMLSCYPGFRNQEVEPCSSISGVLVQGWWYTYGYAIPLFYECYMSMRYRPNLTGVDRPTANSMMPNYTTDMLRPLPWFSDSRAWTMYLISGVVVQWWRHLYGCTVPLFYECYVRHVPCLTGVDHQKTTVLNWFRNWSWSKGTNRGAGLVVTLSAHNPLHPELESLSRGVRKNSWYEHHKKK